MRQVVVRAKPAEDTPLSALAIAVIAERAGIPKGVLSIITSNKSQIIGEEFCSNSKVPACIYWINRSWKNTS